MTVLTLEQKQETLRRLSKIAPRWTKVLQTQDGTKFLQSPAKDMDMGTPSECIAGESHGFSQKYIGTCGECMMYGFKMYRMTIPAIVNGVQYEAAWVKLKEFIKHFEEKHIPQVASQ